VAAAACGTGGTGPAPVDPLAHVPDTWPLLQRSEEVRSPGGMVVSSHPQASEVGVDIMRRGGNAVDAAVAVGFALAVVHSRAGNIGGGGFMVIRTADGDVATLDFREVAPAAATRDMYLDETGVVTNRGVLGHLAVGVPGTVAGMAAAHQRFGALSFSDVIAPATALARDGFTIDQARSDAIADKADTLAMFPASASQFLLGGGAPPPGTQLVQPDLARTLQAIADSGPGVFYDGYIADLIVAEMRRGSGIMTKADLASYHPVWRDPIVAHYRGHVVYSMPPPSSGGITMAEILNVLEGFAPLPPTGSPQNVHLLAEAMRRAFIDRNSLLGDPAFVDMPLRRLLSKRYAGKLRNQIQLDRASRTTAIVGGHDEGQHTTHYSVVDAAGTAVAVTTTLNSDYGSKVTVTGAGFLLNNEMDDFTAAPGQPNQYGLIQGEANAIEPGKRMLSAMTPTIVLDPAGELMMILGSPGGPRIITGVLQVISNVLDHGMPLWDAVAAPRVHHQSLPDEIVYEAGGLTSATLTSLRTMGHTLFEREGYSGEIMAIGRGPAGWIGVADPRVRGGAAGY
jgi:gamma-glutamyltranspeptidase/glutathione hydrolase